jgi:hypothetical protein
VHDVVVAPFAIAVGLLARRVVPDRWWRPVQSGLVATAAVLLLAWRPLTGSGAWKHNVSIQPLDYRSATATALGVVWSVVLAWSALRWLRARRAALSGARGGVRASRATVAPSPRPPG